MVYVLMLQKGLFAQKTTRAVMDVICADVAIASIPSELESISP